MSLSSHAWLLGEPLAGDLDFALYIPAHGTVHFKRLTPIQESKLADWCPRPIPPQRRGHTSIPPRPPPRPMSEAPSGNGRPGGEPRRGKRAQIRPSEGEHFPASQRLPPEVKDCPFVSHQVENDRPRMGAASSTASSPTPPPGSLVNPFVPVPDTRFSPESSCGAAET
jgi:hypothetical protein